MKTAEAIVEKVASFTTEDAIALGCCFVTIKEELDKANACNAYHNLPYDERKRTNEDGTPVHTQPESSYLRNEHVEALNKLAKLIDKIAVYPTSSNIFD